MGGPAGGGDWPEARAEGRAPPGQLPKAEWAACAPLRARSQKA
jgi:hypothetical protein